MEIAKPTRKRETDEQLPAFAALVGRLERLDSSLLPTPPVPESRSQGCPPLPRSVHKLHFSTMQKPSQCVSSEEKGYSGSNGLPRTRKAAAKLMPDFSQA